MPELPDVTVYVEALERKVVGRTLTGIRLVSPFLVRSVDPPWRSAEGRLVEGARRHGGKRIVLDLAGDLHLVFHLMIAGRFRWRPPGAPVPARYGLAAFDTDGGTLLLTEAGSKKRASLHVVAGEAGLAAHDRGGLDALAADDEAFAARLRQRNQTLKRALTEPTVLAGIGNAYSDEILHRARRSPFQRTGDLDHRAMADLRRATREVLVEWTDRLRAEVGDGFPEKVTAFREGMAVHGQFGQPCPVCSATVGRVVFADREFNYCPGCQTGGRVLADRSLSRLFGKDWPPPDWV